MTDAEKRVREVWLDVKFYGPSGDGCHVEIGPENRHFYGNLICNAWSAALAFTESRLEEIRQLREEIKELPIGILIVDKSTLDWWSKNDEDGNPVPPDEITRHVIRQIRRLRTISRLQRELEQLQQGTRPEVLK